MSFALNEVDALVKKAARGAGFSWGMSEEAGKAARWLCVQGLDGCGLLVAVLGASERFGPPVALRGTWQAADGPLCPLRSGAALSDTATLWRDNGLHLSRVAAPAVLLPFAAMAARALGASVTLRWNGTEAVTDGSALQLANIALGADTVTDVSVAIGGTVTAPCPRRTRATPRPDDWASLTLLAQKTYAPETEESRLKGAGAGLSDND